MENWVTIRNLKKKNPDMGTRKIARLCGVSRNTVKRALTSETFPRYCREPTVPLSIDPFKEYIRESYLVKKQKVSVIIENLRSKGFTGTPISLYRYIAHHMKPERDIGTQKSYEPYSTLPGEQMLYDWAEYEVLLGNEMVKVYVHLTEMGFSRYKILDATVTVRMGDIFEALENAFSGMKGLAHRIQVDNARVFVTDASTAHFAWNRQFLEFCGFYGIRPTRSLPGHPWSKGKVEKPFQYVEDHFITNNRFESFEDLYRKLKIFEKDLNEKIHTVTKRKPVDLFTEETNHLLELPRITGTEEYAQYKGHKGELRKVSKDCLVCFGSNRYSVPHFYAGQDVWVRVSKGIYVTMVSNAGKIIAAHLVATGKGQVVLKKEHYKGHIHQRDRESFFVSAQALKDRFGSSGYLDEFLDAVKSQRSVNVHYHLFMIRRLFDDYADADCQHCMEECRRYRCFTFAFIKGYLAHRAGMNTSVPPPSGRLHEIGMIGVQVKRSMEEYRL